MKLSDIFTQLTHGELSQVSLGGAQAGAISEANYALVVSHINLGLVDLHTRFSLREGRQTVSLVKGQYVYQLTSDVLKVLNVFTDLGTELGLNDSGNLYACSTPSASMLRVPVAIVDQPDLLPIKLQTSSLEVLFREGHPTIEVGPGDSPAQIEVDLPLAYLRPLLLFVASRVYAAGTLSGQPLSYNSYYAQYLSACQQLEDAGLDTEQGGQEDRLRRTGWV